MTDTFELVGLDTVASTDPIHVITGGIDTHFKVGDRVKFKNGSKWDGRTVFTIKTIEGDNNHSWMTAEEGPGTAALYSLDPVVVGATDKCLDTNLWTEEKIAELDACVARLKQLEFEKKKSVYAQEGNRTKAFFADLQVLLRKHKACVFARPCAKNNKYAEVWFQFLGNESDGDHFNINTKRSHSSAGEFDWLAKMGNW